MSPKIKWLIGLTIVLLAVIAALALSQQKQAEEDALIGDSSRPLKQSKDGILEPLAEISDSVSAEIEQSGDVDAIVNAIISDQSQDLETAQSDDADLQTLEQDSSLINSGGIYNENEF